MKKTLHILTILLISISVFSQNIDSSFAGKYTDEIGDMTITEICLRKNGTFYLKTPDAIFSYTHQTFENEGIWISRNDSVILNPELTPLKTNVALIEKNTDKTGSILIKVKYFVEYFRLDSLLLKQEEKEFKLITVCVNKKRNYFNLVRHPHRKMCAFAPKVKKQVLIDSTNTFKITRNDLNKIGIFTYGFDNMAWVNVSDKNSNYLEIEITQRVDIERTPRNRELIIEGDRIYFYKRNGKVDKSLSALTRKQKTPTGNKQ